MTATITTIEGVAFKSDGLPISGDAATLTDAVEHGPAMAEYLGRTHGAPSRLHLGFLWGDNPFGDTRPDRMVAKGDKRTFTSGITGRSYRRVTQGLEH